MNPAILMKLMTAKNTFENNHPKFAAFLRRMAEKGVAEGTVIEITLTGPDGNAITGNMRVTASDMQLIDELRSLAMQQQ